MTLRHRTIFIWLLAVVSSLTTPIESVKDPDLHTQVDTDPPLRAAGWNILCDRPGVETELTTELTYAMDMARKASQEFTPENQYVQAFWPNAPEMAKRWWSAPNELKKVADFFSCISKLSQTSPPQECGSATEGPIFISCCMTPYCLTPDVGTVHAHTDNDANWINLCPAWFAQSKSAEIQCKDGNPLSKYESRGNLESGQSSIDGTSRG